MSAFIVGKSGFCSGDKQTGTLGVHSNLSYRYEVR
jgi:hypothetical protein